ncbi:hypothetical protein PF002_g24935, partial [Phytophthora fragariae]
LLYGHLGRHFRIRRAPRRSKEETQQERRMGLDTTDATEDPPASQDAKTLVPMSLSLVAKKEKILQMEAAKLEILLGQRNEMLGGLRESHEYLLTTNGQLQERSRLRREKLASLRTLLVADQEQDGSGLSDAIGANELEATAEKCGVLKEILLGLVDKRAALEQQCMVLEDQTVRDMEGLRGKEQHLNEARSTLLLLHEDIRSAQWNFENDEAELAGEDKRLNTVSQNAQREAALVEKANAALRSENAIVDDLDTVWRNYRDMAHEEHRQLAIANEDAKSEQRELHMLLESNGATCPADEEVLRLAEELQSTLQRLNEEVNSAKFFKRELAFRRKQEKDMLTITQSSIKAKDEQLTWLERQRVHIENEHKEAAQAHAADEAAYQGYLEEHKVAMASLENQIKDAGKQVKTTERAITARNKKVATLNKKVAQKKKVLEEWKTRIDEKQEQVAKSAATQELIDGEVLGTQTLLERELRCLEHAQQLRATQEMEAEELCSSCTTLESETQQLRETVETVKSSIVAAQTAVKNRTDEIREKFLDTFVIDDAEILIELLNKEIESWTTKDTDEVNATIASEANMLNQRYGDLGIDTRKKYGKILRQKERQYNAKLKKLKAREAEKQNAEPTTSSKISRKVGEDIMEKPTHQSRVTATSPDVVQDKHKDVNEQANDTEKQNSNPPCLENRRNEGVVDDEAIPAKSRPSKAHLEQQRTTATPKHVAKSARRTLAPRLSLADQSPQTDNELTDLATCGTGMAITKTATALPTASLQHSTSSVNGARRSRLKRRTPAQKAGKTVAAMMQLPGRSSGSVMPEHPDPEDNTHTLRNVQLDPAEDGVPSQGSLDSPVGCDEDPVASRSSGTNRVKKSSGAEPTAVASQGASEKPQVQTQVDQRNKGIVKRRTKAKVSHRNTKTAKVGRISLGRSQAMDWTAGDSFSFD